MRTRIDTKLQKKGIRSRCSGVLLPVSALPSDDGFGTLGGAFKFIDFLHDAGQSVWQILPLNPVDKLGSPYNSSSAFAIDPLYIDVGTKEYILPDTDDREYFKTLRKKRMERLWSIFSENASKLDSKLWRFAKRNRVWIWDFCLFSALQEHFSFEPFCNWPDGLNVHDTAAVQKYAKKLSHRMRFYLFLEYMADTEWQKVRRYARRSGVYILGDMPFYVAEHGADVWTHRGLFKTELSAGVPPDYFSEYGQKWNTPVYNWDKMRDDGFKWWCERVKRLNSLYDIIRIDHFRAIESFYVIDRKAPDAQRGHFEKGPGIDLLNALFISCHPHLIAEDLGTITQDVRELLDMSGLPGMSVLQFAFDGNTDNPHLPFLNKTNRVFYTGTHDNETLFGWYGGLDDKTKGRVLDYFDIQDDKNACLNILDIAMGSEAGMFIAQMQDYLELGNDARINTPGKTEGNWRFSLKSIPDDRISKRMAEYALKHHRLNKKSPL